MTQPTVLKHWRKIGPKDQNSIPPGKQEHNEPVTMFSEPDDWLCTTRMFAIAWNSTFWGRWITLCRNSPRQTSQLWHTHSSIIHNY